MNDINEQDKEFINAVWQKVSRIEYERNEMCEKNKRNMLKKQKIFCFSFILSIIVIIVLLSSMKWFDKTSILILGIYVLGGCCYFENSIHMRLEEQKCY